MLHIHTCAEEVTIRVRTLPSHYSSQCCRVVENFIEIVEQRMPCNTHVVCFPQTLICLIDKKTGEKTQVRPRFIKQDQVGVARLEVNGGVICLETFKDFPQMGRFTLRDEGHSHFLGNVFVDGLELFVI
jgi:translation elongation factor EF-1alpha